MPSTHCIEDGMGIELIFIPKPLNDSDSLRLALCLIPEILKRGGGSLPSLNIEKCRPGTELKVSIF